MSRNIAESSRHPGYERRARRGAVRVPSVSFDVDAATAICIERTSTLSQFKPLES